MTRSGWHPCQDKCARCARARIRSRVNCGRLCLRQSAASNYEKLPVKNAADYKSGLRRGSIAVKRGSGLRKALYRSGLRWLIAALELSSTMTVDKALSRVVAERSTVCTTGHCLRPFGRRALAVRSAVDGGMVFGWLQAVAHGTEYKVRSTS
jgi:hypothetical protein